jgi:hypothetical protein
MFLLPHDEEDRGDLAACGTLADVFRGHEVSRV